MPAPRTLREKLIEQFDAMTPQMQYAARYLLDNPQEIALMSMRDLARNANVQPATMTRLAQFLGASGYEELRNEQVEKLRHRGSLTSYAKQRRPEANTPASLAGETLADLSETIAGMATDQIFAHLNNAAATLTQARHIHILGSRSCHSVAWQFYYVMSLLGRNVVLLDGPAGTGPDRLMHANEQDALLVISVSPYTRQGLEVVEFAAASGVQIVAITDSEVSPLMQLAHHAIICPVDSPCLFHSLVPAMAVSEILCGLLVRNAPEAALQALEKSDAQLAALNTYASAIPRRLPKVRK